MFYQYIFLAEGKRKCNVQRSETHLLLLSWIVIILGEFKQCNKSTKLFSISFIEFIVFLLK